MVSDLLAGFRCVDGKKTHMPFPLRFALQLLATVAFVALAAILSRQVYLRLGEMEPASADLPNGAVMPVRFDPADQCERFLRQLASESSTADMADQEVARRAGCLHS
jgi:hypothetical protein